MEKPNAKAAENPAPVVPPDVPAPPRQMSPDVSQCPSMSPNSSGCKTNPPTLSTRARPPGAPLAPARKISPIARFVLETAVMETFANTPPLENTLSSLTQPNRAPENRAPETTPSPPTGPVSAIVSPNVPAPARQMSPDVPQRPLMSPNSSGRKTNPPHPPPPQQRPRSLTPLQLAAARAFAKGGRTHAIAEALQLNRRTLSRWQRLSEFRAEIERVHRALSQPPARPAPSAQLQPTEREFLNHVYTSAMKQFMKL